MLGAAALAMALSNCWVDEGMSNFQELLMVPVSNKVASFNNAYWVFLNL